MPACWCRPTYNYEDPVNLNQNARLTRQSYEFLQSNFYNVRSGITQILGMQMNDQTRDFFTSYTEKTRLVSNNGVEVIPLEVIAETA